MSKQPEESEPAMVGSKGAMEAFAAPMPSVPTETDGPALRYVHVWCQRNRTSDSDEYTLRDGA